MNKLSNYEIIERYIEKCLSEEILLSSIKQLAKETDVTISSISRYVRRAGYTDFAQFKSTINEKIWVKKDPDSKKFVNFLLNNIQNRFVVVSSPETLVVKMHFQQRLANLNLLFNKTASELDWKQLKNNLDTISQNDVVFSFALSAESQALNIFKKISNPGLLFICEDKVQLNLHKKVEKIIKNSYAIRFNSNYYRNKAIVKMLLFIDEVINNFYFHLKLKS